MNTTEIQSMAMETVGKLTRSANSIDDGEKMLYRAANDLRDVAPDLCDEIYSTIYKLNLVIDQARAMADDIAEAHGL